jgi:site-specific DNA-methyltransferase (adenine-specific)
MGSGTTAVVAKALNRQFIGIEISPEYCDLGRKRLEHNLTQSEVLIPYRQPTLF